MSMRNALLACCCLLILVAVACTSTAEEIATNRERGSAIVQAITKYVQDRGQLPEKLEVLVPSYLSKIPKTTRESDFAYRMDDLQGYYLCFDVPTKRNLGCCYNHGLDFWDCGFGD